MLKLQLAHVPLRGIYKTKDGLLPPRWSRLHPEAAAALIRVQGADDLVYSDAFRSPEQSLQAAREKRGVQPPGYSAHNFGLAVDLALDDYVPPGSERDAAMRPGTLSRLGCGYPELCTRLAAEGWYCHRRDGKRGAESWHFNWLGPHSATALALAVPENPRTWADAAEHAVRAWYGAQLALDVRAAQEALAFIRLYRGEVDGLFGPRTREAVRAFQRAWALPETGTLTDRTQRVLAVVTAE